MYTIKLETIILFPGWVRVCVCYDLEVPDLERGIQQIRTFKTTDRHRAADTALREREDLKSYIKVASLVEEG